jgi:hypothetical protein
MKSKMKKIKTTLLLIMIAMAVQAQDENANNFDPFKSRDFLFDAMHIFTMLIGLYIVASFILSAIRSGLDSRLRNKMLDREAPENIVVQLLKPDKKEGGNTILQWVCTLASIGVGLTLVSFFRPFGLHSVAIMAFSIAAGLLGYYWFSKKRDQL